ncbi:hypothetical protein OIDMADRAFT_181169 [Oidiodendron maius Zn]|uniref:Uncharacterized protein n=1 Tax=Oidiodendron maius (strain Zn) TaxID=913774 RepID=A0A0C3HBQ3_OIDMZ|nr:hypothetical protein OIDMADRAFT_181169 [Oidiodendron maius Zn]
MAPLSWVLAIFGSLLCTIVTADSNNYFVYPAPNFCNTCQNSSIDLVEGWKSVITWETTFDTGGLYLSQEGNSSPSLLPNSQNIYERSYIWVVDISGTDGNPTFDLSKGEEFYFSIVQNVTTGAEGGSFNSESFTISKSASSGTSTTPSSASRPREFSKEVIIGISIGLVSILGIWA